MTDFSIGMAYSLGFSFIIFKNGILLNRFIVLRGSTSVFINYQFAGTYRTHDLLSPVATTYSIKLLSTRDNLFNSLSCFCISTSYRLFTPVIRSSQFPLYHQLLRIGNTLPVFLSCYL
jgi:hypothetical protein